MPAADYAKLRQLAALTADDIGESEEDVKVNFAVPLLEALGHTRLRFEHRQRDIVLSQGLPRGMAVLIETKRAGEPLGRHLDQLERYAYQERSLLAVITNGDEIRVYVPLWANAPSFAESLLLTVRRPDLAGTVAARRLAAVLGARALTSGAADRDIRAAQARREQAWRHLAAIRTQAHRQREGLDARLRDLQGQAEKLDADKRAVEGKLGRLRAALERSLDTLRTLYGVREPAPAAPKPAPPTPRPAAPAKPPAAPRPAPRKRDRSHGRGHAWSKTPHWTDAELTTKSTENQRRVLRAFVQAGQRTLGVMEIAAGAGLTSQQAWGTLSSFTSPIRAGRKEPLLEVTTPDRVELDRRGTLVTVVEKYWPVLRRLYAGGPAAASPTAAVAAPKPRHGRGDTWSKTIEWTDADLTTYSTENQRRVLGAFVRAGQCTLGLLEIAASLGIRPQQAWGALNSFTHPVRVGRKEPLLQVTIPDRIERERRGVLITIADKYWPTLCRLYGDEAEERDPSTDSAN